MNELSGRDRVQETASQLGVTIELMDRGPASSLEEAAANLELEPRDIVKTIVAKAKVTQTSSEHSYVIALIPGDRHIDWAKLRRLAGMKKMSMTSPEDAIAATGFAPGTINPFGAFNAAGQQVLSVYADESISGRICMGAGERNLNLFVDSTELFSALGIRTADISK